MDFIEQLPPSLGFTAILVIVDWLSKQGIFIPTHDTITSTLLAELFVLHVFSKHGVPSHCTSDRGSYEIIGQVGSHSFTLRLPEAMRAVHPVFHVSMLEPAASSSIPNRTEDPPPPVEVDGEIEYEIAEILDTKLDRRFRCKLRYLVKWTGYEGTDEETTWISADELNHAQELVNDFHVKYPDKPGPHSV